MKNSSGETPRIGDVLPASEVFDGIDRMCWRHRLQNREVLFVIEGSSKLLSRVEADVWVRESAECGYSEIRYLIASDDGRAIVLELSAIAPLEEYSDDDEVQPER